jgi:outer membrane beta-barrel protein
MTGKNELGLSANIAINGALVDHYGGLLSFTRHTNEWLDLGLEGAAHYTALSSLADQVRQNLPARADSSTPPKGNKGDEIANVAQMRLAGFALARLAPFYGKFNLASELAVHFQAYGMLAAGAGLFHHESVNLCGSAGTSPCQPGNFLVSDTVHPAGMLGVGFRFYLSQRWSLRTEVRGYLFPDSYREQADLSNPSTYKDDKSYLGVLTTFSLGVSTLF